jgi:hypothetical protein
LGTGQKALFFEGEGRRRIRKVEEERDIFITKLFLIGILLKSTLKLHKIHF